jgi:hypothetical protein
MKWRAWRPYSRLLCGRGRGFWGTAQPLCMGSKNMVQGNTSGVTCFIELINCTASSGFVVWVVESEISFSFCFSFVACLLRRHINLTQGGHFDEWLLLADKTDYLIYVT